MHPVPALVSYVQDTEQVAGVHRVKKVLFVPGGTYRQRIPAISIAYKVVPIVIGARGGGDPVHTGRLRERIRWQSDDVARSLVRCRIPRRKPFAQRSVIRTATANQQQKRNPPHRAGG